LGRGATFKEISKQIVASIEINVPSVKEQEEAVKILERVSKLMKLRRKEIEELDNLIKARLNKIAARWPARAVAQFYFIDN